MKKEEVWAGAKIGIFFLICFWLLGYTYLSIALGIMASIAGYSLILDWKDESSTPEKLELPVPEAISQTSFEKKIVGSEDWDKSPQRVVGKNWLKGFNKQPDRVN